MNGTVYLSVQKSNKYWLPTLAVRGTVTYREGDFICTIAVDKVVKQIIKPHATTDPTTESAKVSLSMPRGKNTIILKKKAYAYDAKGKRIYDYLGFTYIKKGTVLNYYGTKEINDKLFYYIGDNAYVNGANVGRVINK